MSFYLGKDRRSPDKALLHITSDTRQDVNSINAGFNSSSVFHSDLPYLRVIDTIDVPFHSSFNFPNIFGILPASTWYIFGKYPSRVTEHVRANRKFIILASLSDGSTVCVNNSTSYTSIQWNCTNNLASVLLNTNVDLNNVNGRAIDFNTICGQVPTGRIAYSSISIRPDLHISQPAYINIVLHREVTRYSQPISRSISVTAVTMYVLNLSRELENTSSSGSEISISRSSVSIGGVNLEDEAYAASRGDSLRGATPTRPGINVPSGVKLRNTNSSLSNVTEYVSTASSVNSVKSGHQSVEYGVLTLRTPPTEFGWEMSNTGLRKGGFDYWDLGSSEKLNLISSAQRDFRINVLGDRNQENFLYSIPRESNLLMLVFVDLFVRNADGGLKESSVPLLISNSSNGRVPISYSVVPNFLGGENIIRSAFLKIVDGRVSLQQIYDNRGGRSPASYQCGMRTYFLR